MSRSTSRVVYLIPAILHLFLCIATGAGAFHSEGSWAWFVVFLIDFPFSVLLLPALRIAPPLLVFGVLGTGWWYLITLVVVHCFGRLSRITRRTRHPPSS